MPCRLAISSTTFTIASALPKRNARPPVSATVIRSCSKHSIAKAMTLAVEIASSVKRPHSSFAFAAACKSSMPQFDPKPPTASYSGPPYLSLT